MTQVCSRTYKRKGYGITVERSPVSGMLALSTMSDGKLVTHRYFDYTVKEALAAFLIHIESKS